MVKQSKVKAYAAVLLAAVLSGCAQSEPTQTAQTPAESTTSVSTANTSEASSDTSEASETPEASAAPETSETAGAASSSEKEPLRLIDTGNFSTDSLLFYEEDALDSEFSIEFDYTYGFLAKGIYDDSFRSPEKFDSENYIYASDTEYKLPDEYIRIAPGETVGNAKIKSAHSILIPSGNEENAPCAVMLTEAVLDGEYAFTGLLRYYYDEEYAISSGDLYFIPDESYAGFPLVCGFTARPSMEPEACAYSELLRGFYAGNLFNAGNRSDNIELDADALEKLNAIFGGETANSVKRVKVTLSDITLSWNDQVGTLSTKAILTDAEEIGTQTER